MINTSTAVKSARILRQASAKRRRTPSLRLRTRILWRQRLGETQEHANAAAAAAEEAIVREREALNQAEKARLVAEKNTTLVFVSHDLAIAPYFTRVQALSEFNKGHC